MKKLLPLLLLSSTLLFSSDSSLQIGYKTTAYDYTETSSGILDTEKSNLGDINGIYLGWTQKLSGDNKSSNFINIYYSHSEGNTDYVGSILGSGNPYGSLKSYSVNTFDDAQLNYEYTIYDNSLEYSFLAGLGYYEWERALSKTQVETYHWYYTQAGAEISDEIFKDFRVGFSLLGQYGFNQKMDADMPGTLVATFDLGDVYTIKAGVPLTYTLSDTLKLTSKLEYEYTKIGKSNVISGYFEPDSQQKNWNFYLGLSWDF